MAMRTDKPIRPGALIVWTLTLALAGCGGDARVELSAADTLTAVARQMRVALKEYHGEVVRGDDAREQAVTDAFVVRVLKDSDDAGKLDEHTTAFRAALAKVRVDRQVEWDRRAAAASHIEAIEEVARGLQRLGIEGLTLEDELQRYLYSWIDARRNTAGNTAAAGSVD
jgi:hypothetical protein